MKIYEKETLTRKEKFLKDYSPDIRIDIKKTSESFGVTIQMIYRWIKEYKENNKK